MSMTVKDAPETTSLVSLAKTDAKPNLNNLYAHRLRESDRRKLRSFIEERIETLYAMIIKFEEPYLKKETANIKKLTEEYHILKRAKEGRTESEMTLIEHLEMGLVTGVTGRVSPLLGVAAGTLFMIGCELRNQHISAQLAEEKIVKICDTFWKDSKDYKSLLSACGEDFELQASDEDIVEALPICIRQIAIAGKIIELDQKNEENAILKVLSEFVKFQKEDLKQLACRSSEQQYFQDGSKCRIYKKILKKQRNQWEDSRRDTTFIDIIKKVAKHTRRQQADDTEIEEFPDYYAPEIPQEVDNVVKSEVEEEFFMLSSEDQTPTSEAQSLANSETTSIAAEIISVDTAPTETELLSSGTVTSLQNKTADNAPKQYTENSELTSKTIVQGAVSFSFSRAYADPAEPKQESFVYSFAEGIGLLKGYLKKGKVADAFKILTEKLGLPKEELFKAYYGLKETADTKEHFVKSCEFMKFDHKDEARKEAIALKVFEGVLKEIRDKQSSYWIFQELLEKSDVLETLRAVVSKDAYKKIMTEVSSKELSEEELRVAIQKNWETIIQKNGGFVHLLPLLPSNLKKALFNTLYCLRGMTGEIDDVQDAFLENPKDPLVFKAIEIIIEHGKLLFPSNRVREVKSFCQKVTQDTLSEEFSKLSSDAQHKIILAAWIKSGGKSDFASFSDEYKMHLKKEDVVGIVKVLS